MNNNNNNRLEVAVDEYLRTVRASTEGDCDLLALSFQMDGYAKMLTDLCTAGLTDLETLKKLKDKVRMHQWMILKIAEMKAEEE